MAMQITAGQNVKKKSNPGPIGFGFGSGHNPTLASKIIASSGPQPNTTSAKPVIDQRLKRNDLMQKV
jgi:hypothetical protein